MGSDPKPHTPPGAVSPASTGAAAEERGGAGAARVREWAALGEWLASPPPLLHKVELAVLEERLGFVGRARSSLAALEADLVAEVARREGDAAAQETLRRQQKRSRSGARKAVKVAAQLEWAPSVADKLADGEITPEAAGLILDAATEAPVDHGVLLDAAESEPDDLFRRTLKDHVNERTSELELEQRRDAQRRRRRCSISEQADGMFHLFAQLDPLVGNQVRAALVAKADELFRQEDPKNRSTAPQRFADALTELVCTNNSAGAPAGAELIVLADYDLLHERITNARLTDGTRLTAAETLAVACDAKILPGIFNKHTGNPLLGRSQRKVPSKLRKQLIARDGGCVGCGAAVQICQVHHIRHWHDGGETTLENTCLLCWRCHQVRVHRHGEEITRHPNGRLTLGPRANSGAPETRSHPPPHNHHRTSPSLTAGTGNSDPPHPGRPAERPRGIAADPGSGAPTPPHHELLATSLLTAAEADPGSGVPTPPHHTRHHASRRGTGQRGTPRSPHPPATLF